LIEEREIEIERESVEETNDRVKNQKKKCAMKDLVLIDLELIGKMS